MQLLRGDSPTVRRRELGATLRRFRNEAGMTVKQVSEHLLCSPTKISRLESGQAQNPTIGTLERLARSMGKRIKIEMEDDCPVG